MAYFCCYRPRNYDGQKWKFSSKKKSKFQILSYRRDIYLKRKLRTSTIQIQPEKVWIFAKKIFFSIFPIFATCSRTPWNFWHSFFWKFQKNERRKFQGVLEHVAKIRKIGKKIFFLQKFTLFLAKSELYMFLAFFWGIYLSCSSKFEISTFFLLENFHFWLSSFGSL